MKKTIPRRFCGILDHFGYLPMMLLLLASLSLTHPALGQGGPCDQISFSIDPLNPCEFAARYQTQTDCYIELRFILTQGEFASYNVNAADGFMVQQISPSELWVTHEFGFIPTGNQVPFLFSLPYDLTTSMSVAFLNDCAQVGCEILGGYPIDPCPDPQTASVIGVKYRECNGLPYINQDKLPGWTIQLLDEAGNIVREELTDIDGNYAFYDLPKGQYYCREVQQPGWTPNVPPSGEVAFYLEPTEQRVINFGNCRDCSCDSIRWTIIPISTGINECCYRLTIQNNDAGCFPDIKINLDPGLAISSWSLSAPGWSVTPLGTTGIQANPPGGFVPAGTVSPITFCVTGGAQHTMTTHTSYTNGQMSVLCETMDTFNCSQSCPDPYNYVQNGNFEQGTPPGGDESIGFAAFWSAIWTGCTSTADYYNTITAPPFGVQNPMPITQGSFGGMWAKPHGSNLVWREGMMNQITPIAANSGVYQMTAKFACLTPVLPTPNAILPVIEVWGVPAGPPVFGTCPGLLGANSSIFPGSVLLGTFTPTANCDKNFQTFNNFTFSAPGFLMDRIFLTRQQAFPGADVYVAVDDICLTKIGGTDCVCIPNSQLQLNYDGNSYPVGCGQGPFSPEYPCPTSTVNVTGNFGCVDASGGPCPNYTIDWVLYGPNGVVTNGAIIQGNPIALNFPAAWFTAGGGYSLRMTTLCPGQVDSCVCVARWIFDCCAADASYSVGPCGNVSFSGFGNGTPPYVFCWDFDGNLSTCESSLQNPTYQFTPGTHTATLQITDANGCVATYSVTFTVPPYPTTATISAIPGLTICQGQNTTLIAGGGNWTSCQWSISVSGPAITVNAPGTYCVTCSDVNGCTATACATVVELPAPQANITGNLSICLGQSTTLTATGGGTYSWTPGGATTAAITVSPTTTSTYAVLVTSANGCTAKAVVTVTVNPLPQADAGPNQTVCQWQTATLTATGGVSYQWSPNNSTANPYITTPIQSHMLFTVTVTGANGCTAVDQMKVLTQVCDCDMNPFVQNGEFENGNPCILPDEDIQNANFWSGIWPDGPGLSTGDYYNTTTCTPSAAFGALTTPTPASCGAFGGFWCFPNQSDVLWREGILNNLAAAQTISPNSGSYMVSMKMACLTPVSGAPRMSVYGVLQNATSSIMPVGTQTLTMNSPTNLDLFDDNGQPGAVLLGKVLVAGTCNNNFMDVGFTFNSSILPGTIDRVFLTRDDNIGTTQNPNWGGHAYLAVDSFCVKPVFDSTTCQCGLLTYAGVYQYVTGWQRPISPGQAPLTLPCPKPGANYSVAGLYHCSPDQCGNNTVDWILDRPAPLPDVTGQSSLAPHPFFHVLLSASDFSQSGNYQLTVTRHCGSTPCSKVFNFKLDNCPCSCDSLDTDVAYGFSMSNVWFPFNACKKRFKPLALCSNDLVTWNIQEVGGPYNATGTSAGNAYFQMGTAVNNSGYYDVCMTVTRTANGAPCGTETYCRRVYIQCGIDPTDPTITRYCDENAVKNGGFNEGSSAGSLGEWGYLAHWDKFGNPGDGQVWVEDTSYAGSLDEGYIVMRGRAGNFAGIVQSVNLEESPYLAIYFDAINYLAAEAPAGTRIDVRLQAEPFWHPDMPTLPLRTYTLSDANGWRGMGGIIPLDSIPTSMRYLVICLQNDDDTENSIVGLDNIEVCNSATTPAPEAVGQTTLPIRIYPNPNTGQFTVDLSAPARPGTLFRITDLSGRMVQEVRIEAGNTQQRIQSGNLPDGMYFLQVLENGSLIGVKKFVKQ